MPYTIKKVKGGYKACKKKGGKCFSKKPFKTRKEASKQIGAISSSEKETQNESFDNLVNQLLGTYVFEASQFDEDDENDVTDVTDQEVSKEVNDIKKQKDKQKASVNPAEVKKIMQGAKKIGVPIGGQQQ
jgi:hypothetical protein